MSTFFSDLRSAWRSLIRAPYFLAVSAFILAFAIGANTAVFSLIDGVLLQPLPYSDPERLFQLWEVKGDDDAYVPAATFLEWRERNDVFTDLSSYYTGTVTLTSGDGFPERLPLAAVYYNMMPMLGVQPVLGRSFYEEEVVPGNGDKIILSHGLWNRRFGGDPDIIDQRIELDGEAHTVIGVMPESFDFPGEVDGWLPNVIDEEQQRNHGSHVYRVIGRLRDGVTAEEAQANMDKIAADLEVEVPKYKTGWGVAMESLYERTVGPVRSALWMFQLAVLLVLLIACANVASLLLVRLSNRRTEMAVRRALGSGRGRLVRQLLAESVLVSLIGGAAGIFLAWLAVRLTVAAKGGAIPRLREVSLEPGAVLLSMALAVLVGLGIGAVTAYRAVRSDISSGDFKESGGRTVRGGGAFESTLVVVEVALALILLVGAGLLTNSFLRLTSIDTGIEPERLLTVRVALPDSDYPTLTEKEAFFDRLIERVEALPGVRRVATTNNLPASGFGPWFTAFDIEGTEQRSAATGHRMAYIRWVSTDYFATLGIPLLRGRVFTDADRRGDARVVVVDEAFAREHFPGEDVLGKRLSDLGIGDIYVEADPRPWEIVGVVGDVVETALTDEIKPHFYVLYRQAPTVPVMSLVVATEADPLSLVDRVREQVQEMDASLPIYQVQTMEGKLAEMVSAPRFNVSLMLVFSMAALLLAAVGLYGAIAYAVSRRTREIGLRMALGAHRTSVVRMVLARGLLLAGTGVGLGLLGAFLLNRFVASFLFEVSATDLWTYFGVAFGVLVVACVATLLPALRATRIDPGIALRVE